MDIIVEIISQIFNTFLAAFVTIPLDNALSFLYVIGNALLLLFGAPSGG